MNKVRVGLLGAGFVANIHMECYKRFVPNAEITSVYTRDPKKAKAFAEEHNIPKWYADRDELFASGDCDVIDVCLPNFLHKEAAVKAAASGRHIIMEKPLCLTLEEADEIIAICNKHGVQLMYAEELCFAPKYERVRALAEKGAFGKIYMIKQAEKHSGPHSSWFYDVDQAGGGVMMDMGCHALAWFRWFLGGTPTVKSVYATMATVLHNSITKGEDNTVTVVEFENGVTAVAEDSWAKHGGMDDRIEVYGTNGVCYADLFQGNAALTYSETGYDYAMEKAAGSKGWSFTVFEEAFNQGYPQELKHFIDCVQNNQKPLVGAEDGKAVLEMIYAAYESAKTGKKVDLPFRPNVSKPIDLWLSK